MKGFEVEETALPKGRAHTALDNTSRKVEEMKTEKDHEAQMRNMISTRGSDLQSPKKSMRRQGDPLATVRSNMNTVGLSLLFV